jgi:hypothetical protein
MWIARTARFQAVIAIMASFKKKVAGLASLLRRSKDPALRGFLIIINNSAAVIQTLLPLVLLYP